MYLVLVRHGESIWNKENLFTGWTDVPITEKGIEEAKEAGLILKRRNIYFDIAQTSVLKRAEDTLKYINDSLKGSFPIISDYRLNERHYGALQGLNKSETANKYGKEQVQLWRRSYDVRPPLLDNTDDRYPGNDPKYVFLPKEKLPLGESLKDTEKRVQEFYKEIVVPNLIQNKNVLIVAHGNSLRALIKNLDHISDEAIPNLEISTGRPIIYELNRELEVLSKEVL